MIRARLAEEVWVSRFATELLRKQPVLDRDLALEVGSLTWQHMGIQEQTGFPADVATLA